ncbi:MAG: hypothetical protein WBL72_22530 [Thermoguttaceae bacterium]|jgi:ABC-type transport system involved in multi-copper enzyme maturation permease subunit
MTPSIFWRVVWKEYRLQRSLWIAMAALTAILQLLVIAYEPPHQARAETLYLLALAFPALYALGCGATLFAGEREAGTYEFQRSLPVRAWAVFVGKIVLALGSTLAMLGLMVGFATFLSKPTPPGTVDVATWRVMAWQVFGFFGLEMFVWAVLFSFATKRVLLAAILGVAAASIGAHLAVAIVTTQGAVATYVDALPWRMVIAAGVALADVWLAARWFREKRGRQPKFVPATAAETPPEAIALGRRFQQPQRMAILGRLIWQHWRQSRGVSLAMAALIVPLLAMLMMWLLRARENPPWFIERHASEIYRPGDKEFFALTILIALASVPLLGICAFLADQRRSSRRFLADHGVPAKYVWLSRQTITLGLPLLMFFTLLLALFFLASALLPSPLQSDIIRWARLSEVYAEAYTLFYFAVGVLGCVLIGVAVGQCCSMFLRSPLLAGLFSLLLTALFAVWCGLMWFWQVNWLWSVLPIPVALLAATRLRAADWLLERNTLRAWLRPVLALLIPAAALLLAVPLYRVYSVPLVDPGFSPQEFAQPLTNDEEATFAQYDRACRMLEPMHYTPLASVPQRAANEPDKLDAQKTEWVRANSQTIAAVLQAGRNKICNPPQSRVLPWKYQLADLARLLTYSAVESEEEGKLDAAIARYFAALRLASYLRDWYAIPITAQDRNYPYRDDANVIEMEVYDRLALWAARKGQTQERITATAQRLEQFSSDAAPTNGVKIAYLQVWLFLSGDVGFVRSDDVQEPILWPTVFWSHLGWERARAQRLLNCITRAQLDELSWAEDAIRRGKPFQQPPCGPNVLPYILRPSDLPYALHSQIIVPPVQYNSRWEAKLVQDYVALVAARRAVRVVLALEAWKLKHGSLPKTLDELVGHGLDRLPVDPYSGVPFQYFRDGLKIPLHWSQPRWMMAPGPIMDFGRGEMAVNVPFLWALGNRVRVRETYTDYRGKVAQNYEIYTNIGYSMDEWRYPESAYDLWQLGWAFPVP